MSVEKLKEAYHDHGEVICDECNTLVNLSDASDIVEAAQLFNEHIENHE